MPDLTDDIARIAALRGKPAGGYVSQAAVLDAVSTRVPLSALLALFAAGAEPEVELAALDALPAASREFITTSPLNISACKYASALRACDGREGELIHLVGEVLRTRLSEAARQNFDAAHPQARRHA